MNQELFENIVLSDIEKSRILESGKREAAHRIEKWKQTRNRVACFIIIGGISVGIISSYMPARKSMMPITVYAQEVDGEKELPLEKEYVYKIEKTKTPLGMGYQLNVTTEDGYYCTKHIEGISHGLDTIFENEDSIYWIPDYWKYNNIKIYDDAGNVVTNINAVKDGKARVSFSVFDDTDRLRSEMVLELSEEAGKGTAKIIELKSYPIEE